MISALLGSQIVRIALAAALAFGVGYVWGALMPGRPARSNS